MQVKFNIVIVEHLLSALFKKPSFLLRREEGVHEVVVALVRDLEGLVFDVAIDQLLIGSKERRKIKMGFARRVDAIKLFLEEI